VEKHRRVSIGDRLLTAGANVTVLALAAVAWLLKPAVAGIVLGVVALVVATAELARRRRRTRADADARRCMRRVRDRPLRRVSPGHVTR
jgi:hypothetical protein